MKKILLIILIICFIWFFGFIFTLFLQALWDRLHGRSEKQAYAIFNIEDSEGNCLGIFSFWPVILPIFLFMFLFEKVKILSISIIELIILRRDR